MSDKTKIYIAGIGMITPVGFDAPSTAAAVKAGMSAFKSTGFYLDDEHRVRMARVPKEALDGSLDESILPDEFSARQIRLLQLATLAFNELIPLLPKNQKLPLFIAGPEQLVDNDQPIDKEFLENLMKQTGIELDLSLSRLISTGRAGGLAAISLAFRYFANEENQFAIIGGVDTFYDGRILQELLKDERLLVGGNMDGFIPGEGAGFILVSKNKAHLNKNSGKLIQLFEPGLSDEPGHRGSETPYRGEGLASAVSHALNNAGTGKMMHLYSSMNGESFFSKEHGIVMIRSGEKFDENIKVNHPADCFGDLGAAFAPVTLGISSCYAMENEFSKPCLICCSSDKAPRSAVVLQG